MKKYITIAALRLACWRAWVLLRLSLRAVAVAKKRLSRLLRKDLVIMVIAFPQVTCGNLFFVGSLFVLKKTLSPLSLKIIP